MSFSSFSQRTVVLEVGLAASGRKTHLQNAGSLPTRADPPPTDHPLNKKTNYLASDLELSSQDACASWVWVQGHPDLGVRRIA